MFRFALSSTPSLQIHSRAVRVVLRFAAPTGALLLVCSAGQFLLAYVEWRDGRRRDRTCLLEDDDFGDDG